MRTGTGFEGLHVLVDDNPRWSMGPALQAEIALENGARVVQLRAKHARDAEVLDWARSIQRAARAHDARFVVNDRFDIALAAQADAVHLGQDDLSPEAIPPEARKSLAVGRSTHLISHVARSVKECVDYLGFGPVFGTRSKHSAYDERGVAALREAVGAAAGIPVIAIGGVDLNRVAAVREAGASGFAVISAVAGADDPGAAVRALASAWDNA